MKFKPTHKSGGLVVELSAEESQLPTAAPEQTAGALPVFRLKKILVPIDFSDCSKKALAYAIPFAHQFGAEVTLLHVLEPYPPMPQMDPVDQQAIENAKTSLQALGRSFADRVDLKALLRMGDPHTEIVEAAKELGSDLIILSTHGRTGLAHVLLGSTTEKVARFAGCPILIVREEQRDFVADPLNASAGEKPPSTV